MSASDSSGPSDDPSSDDPSSDDPSSDDLSSDDLSSAGTSGASTARASDHEPIDLDLIERLALALVDNLGSGDPEDAEALSIGIMPVDDEGLSIAVRPLLGPDPIDSLVGFTAPADWVAVGVISTARWASITDEEAASGRVHRAGRPVAGRARLAHIVTRQASSLVVLRQDHDPPVIRRFNPRDEHFGRVDDVCRRVLGLSTSPPIYPTVELWTVMWADAVVRRAAAGEVSTWFDIAGAHPVVDRLSVDEPLRRSAAEDLVELAASYADLLEWDDLRHLCARRQLMFAGIEPTGAAWMDAGMFSRWALAPFPELSDLFVDLDALLPEALMRRVRAACRAWGLP